MTSNSQKSVASVKPNPNVIFRRLGDEVILFHLANDRFYELNGTAARFWELLNAGKDTNQIREQMLLEFAVDSDALSVEADGLLDSLRQEELITVDE